MGEMNLTKRLLIAYVWMTGGLWFISWGMAENGADTIRNPVWPMIVGVRNFLTWIAVGTIASGVLFFLAMEALSRYEKAQDEKQKAIERAKEREAEQKSRDEYYRKEAERAREERERKRLEQEKRLEAQRIAEEKDRQQKQMRSAEEAAESALNDF